MNAVTGPVHSSDNITVWLPSHQILFEGCLIKSVDSRNLGNLSDAVVGEWDITVRKISERHPDTITVVPGHGSPGGKELLMHTIRLAEVLHLMK